MKVHSLLVFSLVAALCLSACGGAPACSVSGASLPAASSSPAGSGAWTDIPCSSQAGIVPVATALTPEAIGRAATTTLHRSVEGMEEDIPATLFIGDGYSLYLPDDEWEQTQHASRADCTADLFAPVANDTISLSVVPNYSDLAQGDMTLDEAYAALQGEGYTQSDDNDHLFAKTEDNTVTCQYVTEPAGVVWYVCWSYPDTSEYLEGWGSMLPVIAQTFAANPAPAQ